MGFLQDVHYYWVECIDSRVIDLPLIGSSYTIVFITFAYLYFVLGCGPRFMKNKSPYSLKPLIKLYNISQIALNIWLIYDILDAGLFTKAKIICPVILDYSYNSISMRVIKYLYYFFLMKLFDFVETVIFVLRKKNNQISGLHLYHHVFTMFFTWMTVRYVAVAPAALMCMINNCIHTIMYTYYFLSSYGPNIQKVIVPMKRWITAMQMVQFVALILYLLHNFWPGCKTVPHWVVISYIGHIMLNFYMFYNFYQKTYRNPKRKI